MNPKEKARAGAEETVRAMGWPESIFMTDHLLESELTHARHDGLGVAISVWCEVEGARPDASLTCEVMDEEKALHVLGVPAPGEVPGLLGRYADITESIHDGPRKYRVSLEDGEVLTEPEVNGLLRDVTKMTPRRRLDVYLADVVPALRAPGWDHAQVRLDLAESVGCWEDEIAVWGTDGQRGTDYRLVVLVNSGNRGRGLIRVWLPGCEGEWGYDSGARVCHEELYIPGAPVFSPTEVWERHVNRYGPPVRMLNARRGASPFSDGI